MALSLKTYGAFIAEIAVLTSIDLSDRNPSIPLFDLFDSVEVFELVLAAEELSRRELPLEEAATGSLQGLHTLYLNTVVDVDLQTMTNGST
jgi:acyl carrier protein